MLTRGSCTAGVYEQTGILKSEARNRETIFESRIYRGHPRLARLETQLKRRVAAYLLDFVFVDEISPRPIGPERLRTDLIAIIHPKA